MFSRTIFKQTLRSNVKLWLIFTLVLSVLNAVLIAVFDDSSISGIADMVKGTPLESMLAQTTFLGMLAQTFYSLHGVLIPIVFIIMTANSLIASQVDRGSMAYLLSTPTPRYKVAATQAAYLVLALVFMFIIETTVGVMAIQFFHDGMEVDMAGYLMLNAGLFLLMFAISGISFFFSCLFNLSKHSLALGAGIPLLFFLFQLMSTVDASLEKLQVVTLNALFDTSAILAGEGYMIKLMILAIVGVMLYMGGMKVFKEKDLPL